MKNSSSSYSFLPKKYSKKNLFRVILLDLLQFLISSDRIQVRQKKDRYGRSYWQAYDPASESKITLASEAEMRIWIEQHYYK
ncbi:hypothetical protein [Gloeocapsopsis dulcis]|uniref:Uncharacterized protein n=1 Tax=Gloeocapsopsis dulcis AAB1 = 1H9 TaxID=1433147 RepID=A0A6N8FU24_9CHRO|nr:hypothetical protein [Gloeocapsopsis dulcis]MUL36264.1 hypothetical protein [Gloeocapsopsis dulcis AAB1 = 1H9]WNN89625.1 hypothetical protein P0S91_00540 [Gloeocapsopsis dulcis]